MPQYEGFELSEASIENLCEAGISPSDDLEEIRAGAWTRETLLEHCLEGADEDRHLGWRQYVDDLFGLLEGERVEGE